MIRSVCCAVALLASAASAQPSAPPRDFALVGARLLPVGSAPIERGTLVVRDGKIAAIGANVSVPDGVESIDVSGAVVTPGLIDLACHLGLTGGLAETVDPIALDVHAADAFDPFAKEVARSRSSGVTTFVLALGDGAVVPGHTAVVKMPVPDQIHPVFLHRAGALQAHFGTPPASATGAPTSRLGASAAIRGVLDDAATREAFGRVVRRLGMLVSIDRASDATAAVRFGRAHGFAPCVFGAPDLRDAAAVIGKARAAVAFGPFDLAMPDRVYSAPAAIVAAGGRVGFASLAPRTRMHDLRATAALAVRGGLDPAVALRGLTLTPAEIVGAATRVGSLEVGKDADLVVWSGDPLSLTSSVRRVIVDGRTAWSAKGDE